MTPPQGRIDPRNEFLETRVSHSLIFLNVILALVYFYFIMFVFERGNAFLYWVLVGGEIFHMWQLFTYLYTVWNTEYEAPRNDMYRPTVDIFVTVCGEPIDVVETTIAALKAMEYPDFEIYILNDGYVAKKDNWEDIEALARRERVHCITRKKPGGAKAGNINNAFAQTHADLVAIFDADHIPHADFLQKTVGYFGDPKMGFVQSPQYYRNYRVNDVTEGAYEQQALFFGAICKGKNRLNSVTMCGTNMVIRREALAGVGGIYEKSIAEDFVTGLLMHQKGWKSYYVGEVLAEGLAPEDFLSYYKQQFRWARGSLDVLFGSDLLLARGLTMPQRIQYLSSLSYFISGLIVLMNAAIPIIFLFTGMAPLAISTMKLAALFLPYIFLTIYVLQVSSNFSYSFTSLSFSMASFPIHISAIFSSMFSRKVSFSVTSKRQLTGNFMNLVIPHILYGILVAAGLFFALIRTGVTPSLLSNFAWALLNITIFSKFITVAMPQRSAVPRKKRMVPVVNT